VSPGPAARYWAELLAAWAIPADILERAPEPPWGCPPALFAHAAEEAVGVDPESRSPSARRALEALPEDGSVLDVGAGGGAASLPLAPPAGRVTAVDQSPKMLAAFAALAERVGVAHAEVEGSWPEVAAQVELADVVVCHHVFYNVGELPPFVQALTGRARRRVVVELTAVHPQAHLNDLWRHFHGTDRPTGPTAEDAAAVVAEMGLDAGLERFDAPSRWTGIDRAEVVTFVRRRLCLTADRDPEIDAALGDAFAPRPLATLWWPGGVGS
jgi:SAM-dependent methyltransferase